MLCRACIFLEQTLDTWNITWKSVVVSDRTEGGRKRTRGKLFSLNLYTLMHSCKEFKKFKFEFSLPGFYEGIFIFQGRDVEHVI